MSERGEDESCVEVDEDGESSLVDEEDERDVPA